MIIGQEKIRSRIDSSTVDTFPRTLMLLGDYGSGKHTVVNYIASKFNLEIEDISNNLTLEYIDNINQRVSPYVYIIESNKLTIKNENVILKFLEEPLKNSFVVVLSERRHSIIPTILNRCQIWEMESYDYTFLKSFIKDLSVDSDILLKLANTPGKVIEYQTHPIDEMIKLAFKIFDNIEKANIANILTLSRFIAFKNEKDRFNVDLFFDVLLFVIRDLYGQDYKCSFQAYLLTSNLNNYKYLFNVDKKALFENYLINLKSLMGGMGRDSSRT